MIRKFTVLILFMLGLTPVLFSQDAVVRLSLKEACLMGVEQNIKVQNALLDTKRMNAQIQETRSRLLPQIEGYSTLNYYYSIPKMILPGEIFGQTGLIPVQIGTKYDFSNGLKASMMLFNQSYFTSVKLARKMENLSSLSVRQQKEEVVYQVTQIYYLCLTTAKQIEFFSKNLENSHRMAEVAKLQSDNGIIRKIDFSRVSVNESNIQTQLDNLEQLEQQQQRILKYLVGINSDCQILLTDSLEYTGKAEPTIRPDFNDRTEILLINNQIDNTALARKANQQAYWPTLTGIGQYYYQGQRNSFDYFKGGDDKFFKVGLFGISLSIPVFDGFEKRSKTRQYDIQLMQMKNTLADTKAYLTKEYADATGQYQSNLKAILRQTENIKVAEASYQSSLQGYRQQVVSLSDLLLSESSLTEAWLSFTNALLQLKNAELDIKKAKGELLNF